MTGRASNDDAHRPIKKTQQRALLWCHRLGGRGEIASFRGAAIVSGYPHLSEALPQLATPEEIAPLLSMSSLGVVRQCRAGKLPGLKIAGRWLIHVRKLAEQLDRERPEEQGRCA